MASAFDGMVAEAVALLPADGSGMVFDTYKQNLYAQMPEQGRDVFAHMIKADIINKVLDRDKNGNVVLLVSRKAAK